MIPVIIRVTIIGSAESLIRVFGCGSMSSPERRLAKGLQKLSSVTIDASNAIAILGNVRTRWPLQATISARHGVSSNDSKMTSLPSRRSSRPAF